MFECKAIYADNWNTLQQKKQLTKIPNACLWIDSLHLNNKKVGRSCTNSETKNKAIRKLSNSGLLRISQDRLGKSEELPSWERVHIPYQPRHFWVDDWKLFRFWWEMFIPWRVSTSIGVRIQNILLSFVFWGGGKLHMSSLPFKKMGILRIQNLPGTPPKTMETANIYHGMLISYVNDKW